MFDMAPVVVVSWFLLLLGSTVAQPSYQVDGPGLKCCYGRATFSNGQTVSTLPECCASLVCHNGDIRPRHFGPPGSSGCCEFDGQMYPNGAHLSSYCVPLVCRRGNWTYSHEIEECCKMCQVYDYAHFVTYDGYLYHWHGGCNYTITQTGRTHYPGIGVFSVFRPCFSGSIDASCLHMTTFKNDENTIITLHHAPHTVTTVNVNGEDSSSTFVVPASGVHHLHSGSGYHPVLTWRDGNCIFLAGSSRILIRHCHNQLKVWAYPNHNNKLDGLCGHFNFYQNDDMTTRDGTVHPLQQWPLAFPESWKTNVQVDRRCSSPCHYCKETTDDPCRSSLQEISLLKSLCAKVLNTIIGRDDKLLYHLDTCAWDVCMAKQAQVSPAEQQQWIDEVKIIVRDMKMMEIRTSGTWQPRTPPSTGACSPGGRWKQSCYWCTCRTDASADCATTVCPTNYEHEAGTDACIDGSWWQKDECNWCECVQGGHICTYDACTSNPPTEEVCLYSLDAGSCQKFEYRYYFNYGVGRCVIFRYNGCGGNANNFRTQGECERACGHLTPPITAPPSTSTTREPTTTFPRPAYCNLQPVKGPCQKDFIRYYYNSSLNSCETFTYGSCGGNDNRFASRSSCEETCGVPTPGITILPSTPPPKCSQLPKVGHCHDRMIRYYYSPLTRSCIPFTFTGCGGNDNNFPTQEHCEAMCLGSNTGTSTPSTTLTTEATNTHLPTYCSQSPDPGQCYNTSIRYYYDSRTSTCQRFTYGGCGGNNNNFVSKQWCLASCYLPASTTTVSVTLAPTCYQEVKIGTCFDALWRWYYSQEKKECTVFVYGGCEGNDNNFLTKEECEAICGGQTQSTTAATTTTTTTTINISICYQAKDSGPCSETHKRYYYDFKTRTCEEFYYSGCGGNHNNFHSIFDCTQACLH